MLSSMDEPTAICLTKRVLMTAYQEATMAHAQAVADLACMIGVVTKADFAEIHAAAHRASRLSATALEVFEAHTDEHGC
jgi:hypothetical protein